MRYYLTDNNAINITENILMNNKKQCERCGTIFEGSIGMCPSCGSTMVHEYINDPNTETDSVDTEKSTTPVIDNTNISNSDNTVPVNDKEKAKVDHFAKRDKYALLTSQNIYWSLFLMEIPIIGWIIAIIWSFGIGIKRQRRELARAFLIRLLVGIFMLLVGLALYRWAFRLTLDDLPEVITKVYDWLWNNVALLISRMKK